MRRDHLTVTALLALAAVVLATLAGTHIQPTAQAQFEAPSDRTKLGLGDCLWEIRSKIAWVDADGNFVQPGNGTPATNSDGEVIRQHEANADASGTPYDEPWTFRAVATVAFDNGDMPRAGSDDLKAKLSDTQQAALQNLIDAAIVDLREEVLQ